jgi:hypothetical protein
VNVDFHGNGAGQGKKVADYFFSILQMYSRLYVVDDFILSGRDETDKTVEEYLRTGSEIQRSTPSRVNAKSRGHRNRWTCSIWASNRRIRSSVYS